jgi:hypothetical protein
MLVIDERRSAGEGILLQGTLVSVGNTGDGVWLLLNTGYSVKLEPGEVEKILAVLKVTP